MPSDLPSKEVLCADCAGYDLEWMRHCAKHKTDFCRGCACPECAEENYDDDEDYLDICDEYP